ncbi:hypothetical protein D9M69_469670 [compost metagenome]
MALEGVGQQAAVHVVVQLAIACLSRILAVEVAQVGAEAAWPQGQAVDQADEVLLVELFQLAIVVTQGQGLAGLVVGTGEPEALTVITCVSVGSDRMVVTGVAHAELVEVTTCEA